METATTTPGRQVATAPLAGAVVETPFGWRLAGLAWLTLPVLVGHQLARRTPRWLSAILVVAVPVAVLRPMLAASGHVVVEPAGGPGLDRLTVTVIVTAHNEAAVIANVVADVGAQDLIVVRPDAMELIVIDDRSTDGTGDVARRAAAIAGIGARTRIARRSGPGPRLKSAALASVQPDDCRGDVIVHLDADARIGPGFLTTVLAYAETGIQAMTARRCVLPRRGLLAAAQADEIAADGALLNGRWAAGGTSDFRGNGTIVTRELLHAVGGWPAAITEDIDLATRIVTAHGIPVLWARDAVVWEEPVRSWTALWRQRVRWAEGVLRRTFRYAPDVARSRQLSAQARLDFVLYAGQLLLPGAIGGALLGAPRRRPPGVAIGLILAYGLFQAMLAWNGLADEPIWHVSGSVRQLPPGPLRRTVRSIRAALFQAIWLGTVPRAAWLIATRRGPVSFAKTRHFDSTFEGSGRLRRGPRP